MPDRITYGDTEGRAAIQDGPLEVCFGYARWFGTYFFDDRKTAIDFHEFWDAQSILEEDGEKMFVPLNRQNF